MKKEKWEKEWMKLMNWEEENNNEINIEKKTEEEQVEQEK